MITLLLPERRHATSIVLDRWLARGDQLPDAAPGNEAMLRSVFAFDSRFSAAALTRQFDVGDAGDKLWLRADPAWMRADMSTARMFAHGELGVSASEIAVLTPDLVELFAEHGLAFDAPTSTRWYLECPDSISIPDFADPGDALGDDLRLHALLGSERKFWRVLGGDIQVLLHNHPVNQNRVARGAAPANGLWLWGAGRFPRAVACDANAYFGDDPLAIALARAASIVTRSLGAYDCGVESNNAIIDLRELRGDALTATLDGVVSNGAGVGQAKLDLVFSSGERHRYMPSHRWRCWRR